MHISNGYREMGVVDFYRTHSSIYSNPHEPFVIQCLEQLWNPSWHSVLDLGCGDGLVTKWLQKRFPASIEGCDAFMADRYTNETGCKCHKISFEDIASGHFANSKKYDVMVISYAIDLINNSYLNNFLYNISLLGHNLITIRPNGKTVDHFAYKLCNKVKISKAKSNLYEIVTLS